MNTKRHSRLPFLPCDVQSIYEFGCSQSVCKESEISYPAQLGKRAGKQHPDTLEYELFVHCLTCHESFVSKEIGAFGDEYFVDLVLWCHGRVRDINPNVEIIRCTQSKVDYKRLLGVSAFDIKRVFDFEPDFLTNLDEEHKHDATVTRCSVKFGGELLAFDLL